MKEGKINKLDDIELDSLPLDLVCDEREILILQQSTDEPLICYQINDEQKACTVDYYCSHNFEGLCLISTYHDQTLLTIFPCDISLLQVPVRPRFRMPRFTEQCFTINEAEGV